MPGVGSYLKLAGEGNLDNVRIIQHDAVEVLNNMIVPGALAGVHVLPDPWHKARHNKRRLIQAPLVQLLSSRLAVGGYIHCATDWEDYAIQMLDVLGAEPTLKNTSTDPSGYARVRIIVHHQVREPRSASGAWGLGPGV
jgi:tRNA (guanine-N7-)-methyltransferase